MNIQAESIASKISSDQSDSGSWCIFVQVTEEVGLKLYHRRDLCEDTRALQELAYEAGVGPRAWGYFEMPFTEDMEDQEPRRWPTGVKHVFGYLTEIVDQVELYDDDEEFGDLIFQMQSHGFTARDTLPGYNVGYCRRTGKLLSLDWDMQYNNPFHDYTFQVLPYE